MNMYNSENKLFPRVPGRLKTKTDHKIYLECLDSLRSYDSIIVLFSGGKDSVACVLHLLELGVPKEKIELWHHDIDGGSDVKMDWDVTNAYIKTFADVMGFKLKFSWRKDGFFGELLREGPSQPIEFENEDNKVQTVYPRKWSDAQKLRREIEEAELNDDMEQLDQAREELHAMGYRFKFPAKSADLNSRWCSAYLKIVVGDTVIGHLDRTHDNEKILLISGERREESPSRAKYNEMEVHKKNALTLNRIVHQWRPVIDYSEQDVWNILQKYGVVPHPVYYAGWNRCSCAMCIFGLPTHWAGIKKVYPERYNHMVWLEEELNFTIDNKKDLNKYVGSAIACTEKSDSSALQKLTSEDVDHSDVLIDPEYWSLPIGAFKGAQGGPC